MKELIIKHSPFIVIRRVLGVITLVCAISMLAINLGSIRFFDWIFFISFMISGGSLLTNGFGTEKSFLHAGEGFLKIKWMNRFRAVIIQDTEIEKITLTRFKFFIYRKNNREYKFSIDFLERGQKKEVYDFFIEYTKLKNIELVRDFSMQNLLP
jgi:hypothetical protein